MDAGEREYVVEGLIASEDRLLKLVEGLTPEQWHFREADGRWTIAENVEHVILVEDAIGRVIGRTLKGSAEPEKKAAAGVKDAVLKEKMLARSTRTAAIEALQPTGRWADTTQLVAELRTLRAKSVAIAGTIDAELRNHFFAHQVFGDLDCYQWMIVMSQHGMRHALQIEDIQGSAGYPRG